MQTVSVSRVGDDITMLDTISNTDCLEGMKEIPDKSIDMVLCDLPYGTTRNRWDSVIPLDRLWEQYRRIVKGGGGRGADVSDTVHDRVG